MISFRSHVVSLVAVFVALAVGVALGGGPLSEVGRGAMRSTAAAPQLREAEQEADFGDRFASAAAGRLYAGGLDTHPVAVVTLPGADDDVVRGVTAEVERAGGSVTATYAVQPGLLDPTEKSLVDTLGEQLVDQVKDDALDAEAPTYERIGQLLARAVAATSPGGAGSDAPASAVLQSLDAAELVSGPAEPARRAPLVLVALGEDVDDDILAGVLAGLADQSVGVVAVGDGDAGLAGDLRGLRTSPLVTSVATVDSAERPLGQVSAVLALIRSLGTTGGSFGASGSDGAVPLG
ncbi:copper transporter [Nocardioides sp. GCM10027113]|uniref:copper transporter n=1 Tax=unclassified Nocardioides TaxID=2615069 RepID=UPI00360C421D